jgi:hypothetical protein
MIYTAFINSSYIGAELTSTFKNRDCKIVNCQLEARAKRILLVIGSSYRILKKHFARRRQLYPDQDKTGLLNNSISINDNNF